MTRTVLVIDDEPDLLRLLDYNLSRSDYLVLTASDGERGLEAARRHHPDVVILDVMMPGLDGWEVIKRLRAEPNTASTPILMLTSKAEEADRVVGLELGADDYMTKPFGVRELLARVKALLRRSHPAAPAAEVVTVGPVVIDSGRRTVVAAGRSLSLTATEFNLLRALARRPGRVYSRENLLTEVRADDSPVTDRTVDVHVAALRRKLGREGELIETVRGVGYRIREG